MLPTVLLFKPPMRTPLLQVGEPAGDILDLILDCAAASQESGVVLNQLVVGVLAITWRE